MAIWNVKATWVEDETDATEQWEVNATTAQEAVQEATARMRFQPHHVEVRRVSDAEGRTQLAPGEPQHRPAT